jgi:hypothetical protein
MGCFNRHLLVLLNLADASFLIAEPLCRVVPVSATSHGQPQGQKHSDSTFCDKLQGSHLPTELLDERHGIPSDVAGELDSVNAFKNYVVRLHGVRSGEGWCT